MNEISIIEAVKILRSKNKNIAFIDVRKRQKYVQGFAFGSINCEVAKLNHHLLDLVPNTKTTILFIGVENETNTWKLEPTPVSIGLDEKDDLYFVLHPLSAPATAAAIRE